MRRALSFALSAIIIAAVLLPPNISAQAPAEKAGALAPFLDVCGVAIGVCGGWTIILGFLCASPASCLGLYKYCGPLCCIIVPVFLCSFIPSIPVIIVKILSILPAILTFLIHLLSALLTVMLNILGILPAILMSLFSLFAALLMVMLRLVIVCIPILPRLCMLGISLCIACHGLCGGLGIGCCGLLTRFCGGMVT